MMLLLLSIGLLVIGIPTVWYAYTLWNDVRSRKAYAERNVKYAPVTNLFLTTIRDSGKRLEEIKDDVIRKEGKVFGFNMLGDYTILIAEPELIQTVLSKEFTNFVNRRRVFLGDKILGKQLGLLEDEDWKRLRAVVTPAFSAGKVRRMKICIDDVCRNLINNLDKNRPIVDLKRLSGAFTMDTIIQVAFGVKVDSLVEQDNPIIRHVQRIFSTEFKLKDSIIFTTMFLFPTLAKILNLRFKRTEMDFFKDFSLKIINNKRELYKNSEQIGKANNFIELLMEAEAEARLLKEKATTETDSINDENFNKVPKYITDEELISQCVMFFLAGYDTTATLISIACYNLAMNPDKQEKLYEEIQTIMKKSAEENVDVNDPFELVSFDTFSQMEYLSAVVNETLRITSPALFIERKAGSDFRLQTSDGKTRVDLKKGDIVQIPIWSIHHNEEYFYEPEKFLPERFLGTPTFPKFAFIPFGFGPRNCIARSLALLEGKIALFHIIRNFKLSICSQTKIPLKYYFLLNAQSPRDVFLQIDKR